MKVDDFMLKVDNVFLTLGHKTIFRGLNLEFEKGRIYGLLGQNGAGKSTLGYLLMGLDRYQPDKGKIIFNNEDITKLGVVERARRGITLAWQEPARFEGVSIKEFLTLGGRFSGEKASKKLKMVGLSPERYLGRGLNESLSGGERKRIEMASVMMIDPEVVILDEPDSGIDFSSYEKVVNVAKYFKERGTIVIMITHNVNIFENLDYVYLICNGIAYREGKPEEVQAFYERQCDKCDYVGIGGVEFDY